MSDNRATKNFQRLIQTYLERYATKDIGFAEKLKNDKKSIEECCDYIASQAQKMGVCGMSDMEVYGLAVHYYDEEVIDFKKVCYSVVSNEVLDLTEEEKKEEREKARKRFQDDCYEEYKAQKKKQNKKTETTSQLSLF